MVSTQTSHRILVHDLAVLDRTRQTYEEILSERRKKSRIWLQVLLSFRACMYPVSWDKISLTWMQ